jgi:hypothetical protein
LHFLNVFYISGFYIAGALESGGLTGSKDPRIQVHTTFSITSIQRYSDFGTTFIVTGGYLKAGTSFLKRV